MFNFLREYIEDIGYLIILVFFYLLTYKINNFILTHTASRSRSGIKHFKGRK